MKMVTKEKVCPCEEEKAKKECLGGRKEGWMERRERERERERKRKRERERKKERKKERKWNRSKNETTGIKMEEQQSGISKPEEKN